jgi:chromosome partitioning protein
MPDDWEGLTMKRVLVVDVDAQRNLTSTFINLNEPLDHPGAIRLFYPIEGETLQPIEISEKLHVIPGTRDLDTVDRDSFDVLYQLRESLEGFKDDYDVCVIDTPPSFNNRFIAALAAANIVVSPLEAADYSLQGVKELMRHVKNVQTRLNHALKFGGLVINLVNSRSMEQERVINRLIESWGDNLITPHLVNRIAVSDALSRGCPVWKHNSGESAARAGREFTAMANEVLSRLGA